MATRNAAAVLLLLLSIATVGASDSYTGTGPWNFPSAPVTTSDPYKIVDAGLSSVQYRVVNGNGKAEGFINYTYNSAAKKWTRNPTAQYTTYYKNGGAWASIGNVQGAESTSASWGDALFAGYSAYLIANNLSGPSAASMNAFLSGFTNPFSSVGGGGSGPPSPFGGGNFPAGATWTFVGMNPDGTYTQAYYVPTQQYGTNGGTIGIGYQNTYTYDPSSQQWTLTGSTSGATVYVPGGYVDPDGFVHTTPTHYTPSSVPGDGGLPTPPPNTGGTASTGGTLSGLNALQNYGNAQGWGPMSTWTQSQVNQATNAIQTVTSSGGTGSNSGSAAGQSGDSTQSTTPSSGDQFGALNQIRLQLDAALRNDATSIAQMDQLLKNQDREHIDISNAAQKLDTVTDLLAQIKAGVIQADADQVAGLVALRAALKAAIDSAAAQAHADSGAIGGKLDANAAAQHTDLSGLGSKLDTDASQAHADANNLAGKLDAINNHLTSGIAVSGGTTGGGTGGTVNPGDTTGYTSGYVAPTTGADLSGVSGSFGAGGLAGSIGSGNDFTYSVSIPLPGSSPVAYTFHTLPQSGDVGYSEMNALRLLIRAFCTVVVFYVFVRSLYHVLKV